MISRNIKKANLILKKMIIEDRKIKLKKTIIRYLFFLRDNKFISIDMPIINMPMKDIKIFKSTNKTILRVFARRSFSQNFFLLLKRFFFLFKRDILQELKVFHIMILLACFCFFYFYRKRIAIKQKICRLLLFENGKEDPRYMLIREFGLSNRVVDLLFDKERLIFLNQLIIMVLYTREYFLKIEYLEEKEKEEIVRKIDEFLNNSWSLTALFYCNFEKLKVKPWWCRLIVYISRKKKDPAFFFISELRLSTRITSFLIEEKIYTIEDLLTIIKNTHSFKWKKFVKSEELAYIDLIEIYTTLHNFLHC